MATPQGYFYRDFGSRLAEARRRAKITQEALSKAVGLSRTSIVNIEKGRQPVQLHLVAKLAMSLGVALAELIPNVDLPKEAENLLPDLTKVSAHNRPWVQRIFTSTALRKENDGESKISSGKAQSSRTSSASKNKKSAGSS
jgi:transcriptional regulator with XRE-family HTH domain